MKEHWRLSKEKLVSAEEGLKSVEPVTGGNIRSCDRLIQYAKLVLYIELILVILGWTSYTVWQGYNQQIEIGASNTFRSNRDVEYSTVPIEGLQLSPLKGFKDTINTIKTTKNDPLEEDVIPTEISHTNDQLTIQCTNRELHSEDNFISDNFETTTTDTRLKDSLESSSSEEDKKVIVKTPLLDVSESKEKESLEGTAVFEWEFPLFSHILPEIGPVIDDSFGAVDESKFGEVLEDLNENNEKDESNDVSEFHQTSSEKQIQQQNEKEESSFDSEEVPSSAEIVNNLNKLYKSIEAARKDLHLEILNHDDFLESFENSKTDETIDSSKSSKPIKVWEDSFGIPSWFSSSDSYDPLNADILEQDETSESKSNYWGKEFSLTPTVDQAGWHSDAEAHSIDNFTENNMYRETTTEATNEEDNSPVIHGKWDFLLDFPDENVDSETPKVTIVDMDNYSTTDSERDPFIIHGIVDPFMSTEREPCTIKFFGGLKVMKCSWGSVINVEPSDSSDTTESESDSLTKDRTTVVRKNYGSFFDKLSRKENVPDNTELFDENSDIHDDSVVDAIETSSSSEDSSVTSENSKFETSDTTSSSTIKDSTESLTQFDWHHLPFGQTETILDHEGVHVEKMNNEILVQDLVYKPQVMKKTIRRYANEELDENMTKFYSAMEALSAHIDALHERYLRQHELEDDYISQEFPNEN